tara:strand:- start:740 stop:1069 length:330 start_codon:yes stop_codon:yes gene_type:complete
MRWSDLSPEEQQGYGNGIGPEWFPTWLRAPITSLASTVFIEASWQRHDHGYQKGGTEIDRINCDGRFLIAMRRDVCRAPLLRKVPAWLLCYTFYILVRIGGSKSFNYSE